jgi:hypothetical protein
MPNTADPNLRQLRIYQLNCNGSNDCQLTMLHDLRADTYDLVMIQEAYIAFNGVSRATSPWRVIYPRRHFIEPQKTCSIILVNKVLSTDHWEELPIDSSDISAMRITGPFGNLRIFNVYNDCEHSCNL